jgi:protein subunit release factor B
MADAVRPPPYATDTRTLTAETSVEIYNAGGPGGQHRNKTQNAVRLRHHPSGVSVTASERRSLEANRRAAFARLRARLERLNRVRRPRQKTKPPPGATRQRLAAKQQHSRRKTERRRPTQSSWDD